MDVNGIIDKLNNVTQSLSKDGEVPFVFSCGKFIDEIIRIARKVCPFGKIALIYKEEKFGRIKGMVDKLSLCRFKPIPIQVSQKDADNIDGISKLFSYDDEIRLSVVVDSSLCFAGYYFSSIRNIPCITLISSCKIDGALLYNSYIDCGKGKEKIANKCPRYIIINLENYKEKPQDKSRLFAFVMSKIISLFDYRFYCEIKRVQPNVKAYNTIKGIISSCYKIFNQDKNSQSIYLLYYYFCVSIACYFSKDIINMLSAPKISADLFTDEILNNEKEELFFAIKITSIYKMVFSKQYKLLDIPDYLERAESLGEIKKDKKDYFEGLEKNIIEYGLFEKNIEKIEESMIKEISTIEEEYKKIYNIYLALGGEEFKYSKKFANALKLSGDMIDTFNGMSIVRESGISEYIS